VSADLADLANLASACTALRRARSLAAWVGEEGKPVTPGGVIRPALVPPAAAEVGVLVTKKVRRASDVPGVYRPWVAAVAAGFVAIRGGRAVREEETGDGGLDAWFSALTAVLAAQVADPNGSDPLILCHTAFIVLDVEQPPAGESLHDAVEDLMRRRGAWTPMASFRNKRAPEHPVDAALDVMRDFGVVDEGGRATALGRWARRRLEESIPPAVTPELPAGEFLAYLASLEGVQDIWDVAGRWAGDRREDEVARELLGAAQGAAPAARIAAVELVSNSGDFLPEDVREALTQVWREASRSPTVGPHARAVLAGLYRVDDGDDGDDADEGGGAEGSDGAPALDPGDITWLAVEFALADLHRYGGADAWYAMRDAVDDDDDVISVVRGSGHPGADELAEALEAHRATGVRVPVCQLKISLRQPKVWRRVLVAENVTLGDLHETIRVLFGWGTDHLHVFELDDDRRYSDPFFRLDMCDDEESVRLNRVFPEPGSRLVYVYDFGDDWRHDVVLEKVLDDDAGRAYPVCTGGAGDNPAEDFDPDEPEDLVPFDRDAVNQSLRGFAAAGLAADSHADR
jgi:hypothetical protein